jgi:hypothetical protein
MKVLCVAATLQFFVDLAIEGSRLAASIGPVGLT